MASTYTGNLRLEKQAAGENDTTWGAKVNTVLEMLEDSIAGMVTISTTGGNTTLSVANSATDQARMAVIKVTGTLSSNAILLIPAVTKKYTIWNATSGSYTLSVKVSGGTAVTIGSGSKQNILSDGTNCFTLSDMESGAVMAFFMSAPPAGWTQVTAHNDVSMRIVSGTGGGTGGSVAFTTAFSSQAVTGTTAATTLTIAQIPAHTHTGGTGQTHSNDPEPGTAMTVGNSANTLASGSTGGGESHLHALTSSVINLAVKYVDMILATKV
jgi:hypothetical protein|tara:strand:+ start:1172 stop:1978 length:807 start_codon:yes stop_codon:yes gene_type:complete